jgi:hypothetical protein
VREIATGVADPLIAPFDPARLIGVEDAGHGADYYGGYARAGSQT